MHHRVSVAAALTTAFYAAPQAPDDARRLFEAAAASLGLGGGLPARLPASRGWGSSLVLAREWAMGDMEQRLVDAIEASFEPTWDADRGEFTWGMGLGEEHPRGQFNAFLAAGEAAGPGLWTRLSAAPVDRCPQVVGVDFPAMALRRAEWIDGNLHLRLAPLHPDPRRRTSFRIVGAEPRQWDISGLDGVSADLRTGGLELTVPMVEGELELVRSSY